MKRQTICFIPCKNLTVQKKCLIYSYRMQHVVVVVPFDVVKTGCLELADIKLILLVVVVSQQTANSPNYQSYPCLNVVKRTKHPGI